MPFVTGLQTKVFSRKSSSCPGICPSVCPYVSIIYSYRIFSLESNPHPNAEFLNEKKVSSRLQSAPFLQPPSEVARWVSAAWKAIPVSIIVRSFKKCCISSALDGSEDDILWEDDGEDKDNSDWMTDDSVMSDDGESYE